MKTRFIALQVGICLMVAAAFGEKSSEPVTALKGLDPVELVGGNEVKGNEDLSAVLGRHRYFFTNEKNQATFEKEPDRYGLQFGGACMRMGPLAGACDPGRFVVHEGRIYVFASESCRNNFKKDPKNHIDQADAPPTGSKADEKRGAELLAKAVEGIGGRKALEKISTCEMKFRITQRYGTNEYKYARVMAMSFPGVCTEMDDWGTSKSGWMHLQSAGYLSGEDGKPVAKSVHDYMAREFYRQPLAILKAWQDGKAHAVAAGSGKVGDVTVERVAVGVRGATTTLGVDPKSGRILQIAYRGRIVAGISNVEKTFSDFREVGDATLPFGVKLAADGRPLNDLQVTMESIRVNEPLAAALTTPLK